MNKAQIKKSLPKAKDGVLEVTLRKWEEMTPFIRYFSCSAVHIYRGQADSTWPLVTTLERYIDKLKTKDVYKVAGGKEILHDMQLDNFKNSLRGRGVNYKDLSNNELWALGQHYGLYTPLLDWSHSFFIALYFAFISDTVPEKGYRSVYAINALSNAFSKRLEKFNEGKDDYDTFEIVDSTSDENQRVINQAGLFTKIPFDFNIIDWVKKETKGKTFPTFVKINIPETERRQVLRELNLMNINPKTIFPDLHGSSLNCNFKLYLFDEE